MLLTAVAARIGTVVLVGYDINSWEPAPAHLDYPTGSVALQGFTSDAPNRSSWPGLAGSA